MEQEIDLQLLDEDDIKVAFEMLVEEQKELCENSYYSFFQYAWDIIEPETKLVNNWHVKYLCDILQEEVERIADKRPKTKDLIINIPPRSLKSRISSVMLPAWAWCRFPWIKFIYASYSEKLSLDHSLDCRKIIQSDWYQERWGNAFKLTSDQNVKSHFANSRGGFRLASSVHGTITGLGADVIGSDDILDPRQSESEIERKTANDFYSNTLFTRLNDQKVGLRLLIMQRLHEEDTTGYILANSKDKYRHIKIPIMTDGEDDDVLPSNLKDFYKDGLFFPDRFDKQVIDEAKKSLGEYGFSGQMMQTPSPSIGGMFKKHYWNYWKPRGISLPPVIVKNEKGELVVKQAVELPDRWDEKVCSWDMSFKDTDGTDFVCGGKWGRLDQYKFLLDQWKDRLDFPKTVDIVREKRYSDDKISAVYIEDKANGPAVIAQLKRDVPGIIAVPADSSKQSRAMPMLAQARAGQIFLPHPMIADWVKDYIDEFAKFPLGKNDDQVDQSTHAVNEMSKIKIRVINGFEKNNPKHYREFDIKMDQRSLKDKLYCTMYQEKNNKVSVLFSIWESSAAHLYVFGEHVNLNPIPEIILPELINIVRPYKKLAIKDFDFWCNETFQGKPEESSTSDLWNAFNIYPQTNPFFDRFGSILTINQMFIRDSITVHKSCIGLADQMNEWYQDGDIGSDIINYDKNKGCVLALCHLAGILIANKKVAPPKVKDYEAISKRMDISELAKKAIMSGNFEGYNQGFQDMPDLGKKNTDWMGI